MKKILTNPYYFWIAIVVIFILSRLATWFFPYDSDHWLFFYMGKNWAEGGSLYVTAFDHKPPIIYLFNALMYLCFNDNLIAHRIFFTIYAIAGAYVFYLLSHKIFTNIFPKNATYFTRLGLLLYVFWTNFSQFTNSGNNTENFGILFLLLLYYIYLKYHENPKPIWLFICGIFFALLFWLKPNMSILALPIWIDLVFFNQPSADNFYTNFTTKLKNILILSCPWILLSLFWIWYFKSNNSYYDFMLASFYFSSKYALSAWQGHVSVQNIFVAILLSFLIPFGFFMAIYIKNALKFFKTNLYHRILLLWIIASCIYIAISGSFYTYYYLIVLPVFVLAMTTSIFYLRSMLWTKILSIIFILAMLSSFVISNKQFYNTFFGSVKNTYIQDQKVAQYIQDHTLPNDTLLSYTYGATFYQLSQKKSGTRYLSASHLLLDEREQFNFGLTDQYIKDAEITQPKYLIYPNENNSLYKIYSQNKKAVEYLMSHYAQEASFDQYDIYVKNY